MTERGEGRSPDAPASGDLPLSPDDVRDDFNAPSTVLHYARAAHQIGLWASERLLIERWLPDRGAPLIEIGCGAGRVVIGLWELGYRNLTAVDFADALVAEARSLADLRAIGGIRFLEADALDLGRGGLSLAASTAAGNALRDKPGDPPEGFAGALFLFNGLMQIPGRERRRRALREIHRVCRPGAVFIFTTHDRDDDPRDRLHWEAEAARWAAGDRDSRLHEFGDRRFENEHGGLTFMHLPSREEVLDDLAAAGWEPQCDAMRRSVAPEGQAVREFSDECRFWVARRA